MSRSGKDLVAAVKQGDATSAEALIGQGAPVTTGDKNGWNALLWASCRGDYKVHAVPRGLGFVWLGREAFRRCGPAGVADPAAH